MLTVKENVTHTKIIQKSKFICKLISIETIEEVKINLEITRKEFPGANHYCYAYICDGQIRCSDNGEPSGTAGMPILNVLEKRSLNYVLAIVIRYFGGIKLGAGGLVRAYSNTVIETLNQCDIVSLIPGKLVSITFPYSKEKQIEHLLHDVEIIKREYQELVCYHVKIPDSLFEQIENNVSQYCNFKIQETILMKE